MSGVGDLPLLPLGRKIAFTRYPDSRVIAPVPPSRPLGTVADGRATRSQLRGSDGFAPSSLELFLLTAETGHHPATALFQVR